MALTEKERLIIECLKDPVTWAQVELGETPRWYQVEMLRNPSKRKVSRCGRRIGKCIGKDAQVITSDGPIRVEDLYKMECRPSILTFDSDSQTIKKTDDYLVLDNGIKPVYKITTSTGRINYATGNHPYLTIDVDGTMGLIQIDDMVVGDRIAIPKTYHDLIDGNPVGDDISRLLGYLCGDGSTSQKQIGFTNFDDDVVHDIGEIASKYNCNINDYGVDGNYYLVTNEHKNNQIINLCKEHGLMGKLATEKEVPAAIMGGTKSDIANFLGAYWDCDGWCSIQSKTYDNGHKVPRVEIGCASSSEKLARGIQYLLLRLGIVARIKEKKVKYNDSYKVTWQVAIGNYDDIQRFASLIPLKSAKRFAVQKVLENLAQRKYSDNRYLDTVPKDVWNYIKARQAELGLSNMQLCGANSRKDNARLRTQYAISKSKLSVYAQNLDDEYLKKLATNDILWDEIVSIEYVGDQQTYDLSVAHTHTFIADDIISHNTWTMCIHILWYAFTHKNSRQVIATPYEAQITLIFDQLRKFIDKSPALQQSIAYNRRNPQYIELKNGSTIKGFTAGTKSGSEGGSLRGQGADWVYMDEVDYMTDADFETIYAIALEAPERIGVWVSSTPTGRRGMFWKLCTNKDLGWQEFHYPTMVNPEWSPAMERELRGMFSEVAYQHEVLAEFGEETIGVFKKEFIDRARQDYLYLDRVIHKAPRTIGVDWDRLFVPVKSGELLETPESFLATA